MRTDSTARFAAAIFNTGGFWLSLGQLENAVSAELWRSFFWVEFATPVDGICS
jgi:hypothetical protein